MVTPTSSSVTALLKNWPCLEAVWDCFGLENWLVITSVKQWFFFYYFFCSFVWFCFSLQRSESSPGLCRFISCWTRSLIRLYPRHRGREHSVWFSRNECRLCSYRVSPAILSFVCSSSILHFVCPLSRPVPSAYLSGISITFLLHTPFTLHRSRFVRRQHGVIAVRTWVSVSCHALYTAAGWAPWTKTPRIAILHPFNHLLYDTHLSVFLLGTN